MKKDPGHKEPHPSKGKRVGFIYRWRTDHKVTRHTWKQYLKRKGRDE